VLLKQVLTVGQLIHLVLLDLPAVVFWFAFAQWVLAGRKK
jgi:hypothetical protein